VRVPICADIGEMARARAMWRYRAAISARSRAARP